MLARHYKSSRFESEPAQQQRRAIHSPMTTSNSLWYRLATSVSPQPGAESRVQAKTSTPQTPIQVPGQVEKTVAAPGSGERLPRSIRSQVESLIGVDLAQVRVHRDSSAQNAAKSLNARAFTHKNNIFLGAGQSQSDTRVLAHELTHVAQQTGPGRINRVQCEFACPEDLETEISLLRGRLAALPPASSPERVDLQAQLTWRERLAAQCGRLTGYTSSRADSLAYLKTEAMLHRGRIADASRELAHLEPTSSAHRISLDNERDRHREELIGVLEMRSTILEEEIASLRELLMSRLYSEESSPERELLIRYENEWVAHQNELQSLKRWQARRRINAIQAELESIDAWLQIVPMVCSPDEPKAEDLLNQRTALLDEQRTLVNFLTGSMVEYKQFDPRWGATRYGMSPACTNVRQAGCGPTSLAIVLNYLYSEDPERASEGGDMEFVSPPETVRYAETHGRVCNSGTAGDTMVIHVHTGWPGYYGRRITLEEATTYLRQGIPVIFLCRHCTGTTRSGGSSSYGGHYMVLRSVDASGTTYRVLDPGRGERRDIETISLNELRHHSAGFWVIERL